MVKLKIEKGIKLEDHSYGGLIKSLRAEYEEAIRTMEVGDSFQITAEKYSVREIIHSAFKNCGWKAAIRKVKSVRGGPWTFRVWRILVLCLCIHGCTPRTNLAHQYHVTAIKIGEVETRTDFLLGEK